MTQEEKLAVISATEDKTYEALSALTVADMTTDKPHALLQILNGFGYLDHCVRRDFSCEVVAHTAEEPVAEEPVAEEPAAEEPAVTDTAKTYTRDEVKVTLNRLHREGKINVAELFEQIGYTKMSDIPDSELGKLMALAGVE